MLLNYNAIAAIKILLLLRRAMTVDLPLQIFNFNHIHMVVVTLVTICCGNISQRGNEHVIVICEH